MQGISLLAGTVIYAVSLAADRIWSLYDPILAAGFRNGRHHLTGIFGNVSLERLTEGYRMRLIYEEQSRQMELRLLMQKEHYEKLTDALEEASRTRHDFRQYIRTASILLEQEHYEELKAYFHQLHRRAPKNADTSMLLQEHVCGCNLTLLCVTAGAKRYKVQIFSRGSRENENF